MRRTLLILGLMLSSVTLAAACKPHSSQLLQGVAPTTTATSTATPTVTPTATPAATPTATPTRTARPRPTPHPRHPQLPAVFRGCWQGTVAQLDWINRVPGAPSIGPWTAKTYRLCYRRVGRGPYKLSFADTGMLANPKVINASGHGEVLSTDGRTHATMRAILDFDEYMFQPGSRTFPVHEVTELDCEIRPPDLVVTGTVNGERSGRPWFRAQWHAVFKRRGG